MANPVLSVVMSVLNGENRLNETIESVLSQTYTDFEFIIVNDGSTDNSSEILKQYSKENKRIRIIEQENTGLTRALIRGCAEARGQYIARQDVGDISYPERFAKQIKLLESDPGIVLVSCWTVCRGPGGEYLYSDIRNETPEESTRLLRTNSLNDLKGPPGHATAMFSRKLYEKVGGYRSQFYYAQDLDLWRRLTKYGKVDLVREILLQILIHPSSISGAMHKEQTHLANIILRIDIPGENEAILLDKASKVKPPAGASSTRLAAGNYFIGKLLEKQQSMERKKYFITAIRLKPFFLKAWYSLFLLYFKSKERRN